MKSKLSKNRLERNSDTFSGISSAKDVVMKKLLIIQKTTPSCRVSVQGVKSLGGHFACLCRGIEFY